MRRDTIGVERWRVQVLRPDGSAEREVVAASEAEARAAAATIAGSTIRIQVRRAGAHRFVDVP